jgi:hypothetical protein
MQLLIGMVDQRIKGIKGGTLKTRLWISVQAKQIHLYKFHGIHELNNEHISTLCKFGKNVHDLQHGQQTWQTKNKLKVTKQNQIILSYLGLG